MYARTVPLLVVAGLVALSGCSALPFLGGPPPSDERAVETRERVVAAVESVPTYRALLDGRASAAGEGRTRSLSIRGESVVDRRNRRMVSRVTVDGSTRRTYVDGRTVYTECGEPWGGWGVENVSESVEWFTATPLGRQVALLERTNVYWGGNRTVEGTPASLLVAHPTERTLASLPDARPSPAALSRANVENVTVRMWVDDRTGLPIRSTFRLEIASRDASVVAEIRTAFRDYGDPVTVTVPPSARTDQYELGCPGA